MPRVISGSHTITQLLSDLATDNPATVVSGGFIQTTNAPGIQGTDACPWTVTNLGTIALIGTAGFGVHLAAGGTVTNGQIGSAGISITAPSVGVEIGGAAGTVNNLARISAPTTGGIGIVLEVGGSVTNGAIDQGMPLISGAYNGIFVGRGSANIANFGRIEAPGSIFNGGLAANVAVFLGAGGMVQNGTDSSIAAQIAGYHMGICAFGGPVTIDNFGTITATATHTNHLGAAAGPEAGVGLLLGAPNPVVRNGSSGTTSALIQGYYRGIGTGYYGPATIVNFGTIESTQQALPVRHPGVAIIMHDGGTITNYGLIKGAQYGVLTSVSVRATPGAPGTINNFGTIEETSGFQIVNGQNLFPAAVSLAGGGTVTNDGLIRAGWKGIVLANKPGEIVNNGTIDSISASISGLATTVINYGTIIGRGGIAISFAGSGANRLALGAGSVLSGAVQGSIATDATDTLELRGGAGRAVTVDYNGLGLSNFEEVLFSTGGYAALRLSNTGSLGITIAGFDQTSEFIDLTGIGADGIITYSSEPTDRLTVTGSLGSVTLQFDSIDGVNFATAGDGASGTKLSIACFCRGTRILTDRGEVPVDELVIGDRAVTHFGEARTIRWIGRRSYDGRFIAGNKAVLPIRIVAGALADGVPARDLWVSPEHCLYFDGVLAQAAHLVNGMTITQFEAVERVEYFHIELDTHDILVANGAPAESYTDCDNRLMFENGAEFAALYPDHDGPRWQFCLPRLEPGSAELTAIRAALLARAERLGHRFDTDPDLHLVVGGAVIRPEQVDGLVYRFTVPAGGTAIRLVSRSTVPAEITAGIGDVRRLGVAIASLRLHDASLCIEASHSDAALNNGFHSDEETHRWTDGSAPISAAWLRCFTGAFKLEVRLASRDLAYPVPVGGRRALVA